MRSANLPPRRIAGGREFLAEVSDERPGCLVLDVRMPEIDGLELQRQLAARGSRMPVIMLTGHGDVPVAVQALRAGAFDFIPKPFDSKALLTRIHEAIELDAAHPAEAHRPGRHRVASRHADPRESEVLDRIVEGFRANRSRSPWVRASIRCKTSGPAF